MPPIITPHPTKKNFIYCQITDTLDGPAAANANNLTKIAQTAPTSLSDL